MRQKRTVSMYTDVQNSITDQHAAAESLGSRHREHRQQEERKQLFQRRTLEDAIIDAAEERWREENEVGGVIDPEAGTVTIGTYGGDLGEPLATYRYGFGVNGELLLWSEEEGDEAPAELADEDTL
ncbi:MAG: hypothetical protein M5U20_11505 [Phycisphaerales bacterium]|nr:hypothetical protein [Phycisphaerales bacterium]